MANHSSILDWRIPWTEKPGGLQSNTHIHTHTHTHTVTKHACAISYMRHSILYYKMGFVIDDFA